MKGHLWNLTIPEAKDLGDHKAAAPGKSLICLLLVNLECVNKVHVQPSRLF